MTNGSISNMNGVYITTVLAGGADKWFRANFITPDGWKRGKLQINLYSRSQTNTAGNFDLNIQWAYLLDDETSGVSTNLYTNQRTLANPATVANAHWVETWTTGNISMPNEDNVLQAIEVFRLGATGTDTLGTTDFYVMGIELIWLPGITRT
jgi:hypothetical protein